MNCAETHLGCGNNIICYLYQAVSNMQTAPSRYVACHLHLRQWLLTRAAVKHLLLQTPSVNPAHNHWKR